MGKRKTDKHVEWRPHDYIFKPTPEDFEAIRSWRSAQGKIDKVDPALLQPELMGTGLAADNSIFKIMNQVRYKDD